MAKDVKEMVKQITAEEIKTLRDQKPSYRKKWVIDRFGTGAERKAYGRFKKAPAWADSVVNQINWETK